MRIRLPPIFWLGFLIFCGAAGIASAIIEWLQEIF